MTDEFKKLIDNDIEDCEYAQHAPLQYKKDLFNQLYSKYPPIIEGFDDRLKTIYGNDDYLANIKIMREKLVLFKAMGYKNSTEAISTQLISNVVEEGVYKHSDVNTPVVFISHKSDDKKYGDAIRNFIVGLGVKDNQLIYTSHPLHKIPLNERIYDYLRKNIDCNMFMIILWSNTYLESPACLNEMGALWVTQNDYTSMYVPDFAFGNPKYHECAVDTTKMGAVLKPDEHCRAAMIEFKNKIVEIFDLDVNEQKTSHLIETFIQEIS